MSADPLGNRWQVWNPATSQWEGSGVHTWDSLKELYHRPYVKAVSSNVGIHQWNGNIWGRALDPQLGYKQLLLFAGNWIS